MGLILNPYRHVPATVAFTATASQTSPSASHDFTSFSIGTESPDRYVAIAVFFRTVVGSSDSVSAVTINGVAATRIAVLSNSGGGATSETGIWIAPVPTGTSVTVNVTSNVGGSQKMIGGFALTGLVNAGAVTSSAVSTPADGSSAGTGAIALTLASVPANGVAIAAFGNPGGGSFTWAAVTERFDLNSTRTISGAADAFVTAQTNLAITATPSVNDQSAGCAVSLR